MLLETQITKDIYSRLSYISPGFLLRLRAMGREECDSLRAVEALAVKLGRRFNDL
jgi:hypothetical protein